MCQSPGHIEQPKFTTEFGNINKISKNNYDFDGSCDKETNTVEKIIIKSKVCDIFI